MRRRPKSNGISPRKLPVQERSRATVDAILDATARILVQRGLARTTTNAVADRAGVSVGSLYQYFPGKAALVAALHERHAHELLAVIERESERARGSGLEATVRALVRAVIEAHLVDPALHRMLETEAASLDATGALEATLAARVRTLLERHRTEIAPVDLGLATQVVMRMTNALVHAAVVDPPDAAPPAAVERETVRALLGYLRQPDPQPSAS